MQKEGTLGIHVAHEKSDQQRRISKAYLNHLNNSNTSYEDVFKYGNVVLFADAYDRP